MGDPGRALARCMGGRFCTHAAGSCTATVPAGSGRPVVGVVPLPTVERDPDDERRATAIAFGLWALEAPLGSSITRGWDRLEPVRRELFLARARLVLSYAEPLL